MDFWMIMVLAVATGLVVGVLPRFTKRGKANASRAAEVDALRNQKLREKGIEPLPRKKKLEQAAIFVVFLTFISAFVFMAFLTGGDLDDVFFFPELAFSFLLFGLSVGVAFALFASAVANKAEEAGRGWLSFFWLSLFISPLITWLIVATLKPAIGTPAESTSRVDTLESKLEELKRMKEKGLISQAEFDEAKKKSLGL
jgi:hypothetical protein